jgi:membrane associated rhomboid family serine protease
VIPLRDANPIHKTPWITLAFIALNVVAFAAWQGFPVTGDLSRSQLEVVFCHGAIPFELSNMRELPDLVRECGDKSPWFVTIFTSMFLHANLLHIGGNMLFLWIFGNNVEDRMGRLAFPMFYLAAGVVAAYVQTYLGGAGSQVPLIGASGAIAGTLGAYIVMFPHARILTAVFFFFITMVELPAIIVLGLWFVLQFLSGVGQLGQDVGGGVAFWAHIGGFAFGAVVALLFFRRRPIRQTVPWA